MSNKTLIERMSDCPRFRSVKREDAKNWTRYRTVPEKLLERAIEALSTPLPDDVAAMAQAIRDHDQEGLPPPAGAADMLERQQRALNHQQDCASSLPDVAWAWKLERIKLEQRIAELEEQLSQAVMTGGYHD